MWVVDFPLFEAADDGVPTPMHHPFTMPHPDDIDRLESDPLSVRAQAYDLVLNGWELGSGSVRIHRPDVQQRIFSMIGIDAEDAQQRFGFLLDAFRFGAPPHAGLRGRHRPLRRDPRRRGEHPRGDRVPEDAVRRRPAHRRPDVRSTPPNSATSASASASRPKLLTPNFRTNSWARNWALGTGFGANRWVSHEGSYGSRRWRHSSHDSNPSSRRSTAWSRWTSFGPASSPTSRSRSLRPIGRSCDGFVPRVFGLVGARESWERGLFAAVLSVDRVRSRRTASAARLWNFEPRPEDRYEITVGPRSSNSDCAESSSIDPERSTTDDVASLDGHRVHVLRANALRLHNAARASTSSAEPSTTVCAAVSRRCAGLRGCAERLESGPGSSHVASFARCSRRAAIGFDPGGSRSELHVLDVFRRAGLPLPVQQYRVKIGAKTFRPDFAWPDCKVFAEYYGLPFHTGASAVVADSERLTALVGRGLAAARLHPRVVRSRDRRAHVAAARAQSSADRSRQLAPTVRSQTVGRCSAGYPANCW